MKRKRESCFRERDLATQGGEVERAGERNIASFARIAQITIHPYYALYVERVASEVNRCDYLRASREQFARSAADLSRTA